MNLDYRYSHVDKGETYDSTLSAIPFDVYLAVLQKRWLERLVPEYFPEGIGAYLDFACGTGRIISGVERFASYSCGVDISASMLRTARRKCHRSEFFCMDITCEGLDKGGDFDLITAFRFLGNAQDELREKTLRSLRQLMKPDGLLIINNHRDPGVLRNVVARKLGTDMDMDLTRDKLDALLRSCGLKIVREVGIGLWLLHHRLDRIGAAAAKYMPLVSLPGLSRYAMDYILVLQKLP